VRRKRRWHLSRARWSAKTAHTGACGECFKVEPAVLDSPGLCRWLRALAGFARYFYLAHRDGDEELTLAAAVAFLLMCALAAAEALGWLW